MIHASGQWGGSGASSGSTRQRPAANGCVAGGATEVVGGARHAMSPHTSLRALSRHRFAERIAERIDRGLAEGSFRRLAPVAPPAMLGALRAALSPPCKAHCEVETASDIGRMGRVDIERHLAHSATVARRPPAPGQDGRPHT